MATQKPTADLPPVLGAEEVARFLGWSPALVMAYHRGEHMPVPLAELAGGPVWSREAILTWQTVSSRSAPSVATPPEETGERFRRLFGVSLPPGLLRRLPSEGLVLWACTRVVPEDENSAHCAASDGPGSRDVTLEVRHPTPALAEAASALENAIRRVEDVSNRIRGHLRAKKR